MGNVRDDDLGQEASRVLASARTIADSAEADRIQPAHLSDLTQSQILRSMRLFAEEVMPAFRDG